MIDLVVSYARADRALGERVAAGLERAGYRVAVDRDSVGAARPTDELAVEMREAQAFIPLVTETALASIDVRQATRVALLYDKRLVAGRLEREVEPELLANDGPVVAGTRFEERPDELVDALAQSVDLTALADSRGAGPTIDDAIEPGGLAGGLQSGSVSASSRDPGLRPLLDELKRMGILPTPPGQAAKPIAPSEIVYDSYGFPKSPETMLARWRQIEQHGSIRDFERFELDYEDDPFFATLAAETSDNLRRKRVTRMVDLGARSVVGALFAGLIVWAAAAYCSSENCRPTERAGGGGGGVTTIVNTGADPQALRVARQTADRARQRAEQLQRDNQRLATELEQTRAALRRRTADARQNNGSGGRQPVNPGPNPNQSAALQQLRNELNQSQQTLGQLRGQVQERDRMVADLRNQMSRRDREMARMTSEVQARDRRIADLTRQLRTAGARPGPTTGGNLAVAVTGGLNPGAGSGFERIMGFYRDKWDRTAELTNFQEERIFTAEEIRTLQGCLLKRTGRLSKVDGRWGRETTGALLGVTPLEAGWVIDCVLET